MLTLQFDGLFRGAPQELNLSEDAGFMCYGWIILRDNIVIARGHGGYISAQDASSNVAEYLGLIEGIEALLDMQATREAIMICGDAKSVIEQMQGRASVSASSIKPMHKRASRLVNQFQHILWTWTPRRNNHTADSLTRRALRQIRANPQHYENIFQGGHHTLRMRSVLDLRIFQVA
jgi:ribonuclease HI